MSREADIINRINDIKKEAELVTVLKDIKTELAGIRVELEILRECNVEAAKEKPEIKIPEDESYWLKSDSYSTAGAFLKCAYCGYELQSPDNFYPDSCPGCKRKMRET